jgi:hypothetical protein
MNEPRNLFREIIGKQKPSEIETVVYFKKSKDKDICRCTILDEECEITNEVSSDCRMCNVALAYLLANPDFLKQGKKDLSPGGK